MKTRIVLVLACSILLSSSVVSQEQLSDAEQAKRAALYAESMKPGPEHQRLESLVGRWEQEMKYWPEPGKPPITMKGMCENRMILGGRFLRSESKVEGPMAFEHQSVIGFDRRHKKYTVVGFDSMGTYFVTAAGGFNEATKAIVMYGEDADPLMGHTQKYDMIVRLVGPDKYIFEVVFKDPVHTHGKGEFKAVEVTHTRAK